MYKELIMSEKRRAKIGITIKKDAKIFDYARDKYVILAKDVFIPKIDILDHNGHFRFNFELSPEAGIGRFAYEYNINRGKYESKFAED
jgi:hypothetical protein